MQQAPPRPPAPRAGRVIGWTSLVVVVGALALFGWLVSLFWQFTADDAFIYLRYAANLAAGQGPTWNAGAPPVEGHTSILWVVLLAVPHALGLDPVLYGKIVGVLCAIGVLGLSHRFVLRLEEAADPGVRRLAAAFALLAVASFRPLALHAVSGMDTALFTLGFIAFCLLATVVPERPTAARCALLGGMSLLLGLMRAEGVMLAAIGLLGALLRTPMAARRRLVAAVVVCCVFPGAVYFVWRARYYGHLFPLPFYLKTSFGGLAGIGDVEGFLRYLALPIGPLLVLGALRQRWRAAPVLAAAGALLAFYVVPAPIMGYAWRFLTPAFPPLAVVAACGLAAVLDFLARRTAASARRRSAALAGGTVVAAAAVAAGLLAGLRIQQSMVYMMGGVLRRTHVVLGRKLASMNGEGRTLAIGDAGAVPYYSGWRAIDIFGLNDEAIAVDGRRDPAYVLSRHPDLVILVSMRKNEFFTILPWEHDLYEAALAAGMVKIGSIGPARYNLWVMARPDDPVARELSTWDGLDHDVGGAPDGIPPG